MVSIPPLLWPSEIQYNRLQSQIQLQGTLIHYLDAYNKLRIVSLAFPLTTKHEYLHLIGSESLHKIVIDACSGEMIYIKSSIGA